MENLPAKKHIDYIDLAKGLCILLVVFFHVYNECTRDCTPNATTIFVSNVLSSFRMPFYFFLSGLFYKQYEGKHTFIIKKINKLMIPFLFMFLITVVLWNVLEQYRHPEYDTMTTLNSILCLRPNFPIWFLLCLFELNILYLAIQKLVNNKYITGGVILLLCTCGFFLPKIGVAFPLYFGTALTCLPFFAGGHAVRQYTNILTRPFGKQDARLCLLLIVTFLCCSFLFGGEVGWMGNVYNCSIFYIIFAGFAGTFAMLLISKYFNGLPVVTYIGRYSIVVLCTHYMYVMCFARYIYPNTPYLPIWLKILIEFTAITLLSIPTIYICIKYLPWMFAQKDLIKISPRH